MAQMSNDDVESPAHPALGKGWLAYYHFCQAGHESTLSTLTFVQCLSEALANRYEPFRYALQHSGSQHRISGQAFDRGMLSSVDPSLTATLPNQADMIMRRGYAARMDGPILVNIARASGHEGTALLDEYIKAHAGYYHVQYRNKSLWIVLQAVLSHHPDQAWVKRQLRQLAVAALSGGGVDFDEMLPLTVATLRARAIHRAGHGENATRWLAERGFAGSATSEIFPRPERLVGHPQAPFDSADGTVSPGVQQYVRSR
jgi:hypothetical protein